MMSEVDEERCPMSDLYISQCAHCRPKPPQPRFLEAFFTGDSDSYSFAATWPGKCAQCGEWFGPGAWITRAGDNGYLCSDCTS